MNILGNSIKEIRKSKKMTQKELAKLTGFKQNTISNHENGNRQLDEVDIRKYAKALKIEPQQLFDYSSSPTNPQVELIPSTLQKINSTSSQLEHSRQIIVLDTAETLLEQQKEIKNNEDTIAELFSYNYYDHAASAGTGQYLNDVQVEKIELPVDYDADFVIPVYGDSMEPKYHSGDYVFVKLSVELTDGDIGVFEYYGDAYIKQLLINDEGAFLHSLNSKYEDIPIDRDSDFRIIGEVMGSYRER
ncbi:TPA: S24 family peptidase [Streptococcus pyogenes]|uniref:XRE family transcriptional regulator n=1 Tax=Streptococcus pyogenes TaxID=1314 RepID=UPI0001E10158|nr:S24 family peptidase [Streptococcus pyogenes]HER4515410.1 helix-turn-helix domain-containing protein [Streptococcus pyogenes NGAS743]HER4524277.1 helix-turn-helix domain-containing protein [Streptococcus pyogenes NGAS747]HER4527682.1 helix-turn-helix domain-containing protein [Streptococcus pyogenes NGAS739]HER4539260.1 helix-turn-helix domain-containing protein [Streptococcus pyogenes NGAS668]HER4542601.1 helix-turn-helix domain-containing protein [Streptococcus pyogenes NGAS669]HER455144